MAQARLSTEERRQQIAEAALRILAEQGAHRLTAMEIANAVGIADGTVFRHFKNKEEILGAAIEAFERHLEGDFPPLDLEPLARLKQFFLRRVNKVRERPDILRLAFSDRLEEVAGEKNAERVRAVVARSIAYVRQCLRQAQKEGDVGDDVPVDVLAFMVMGVMRSTALSGDKKGSRSAQGVWEDVERVLRRSRPGHGA